MHRVRQGSVPFLALLAALSLAYAGCGRDQSASKANESLASLRPIAVTAQGRIEPKNGITYIAGPSRPSAVIAQLLVEEGDHVTADQPLAVLDTQHENEAQVERAKAQLAHARRDLKRVETLVRQNIASEQRRDDAKLAVDTAAADLAAAQDELDLDTVRAPHAGQVIAIHARRGERVGPDGIAELARTDQMYAIAEVYETDIGRVRIGQRATVKSPAIDGQLTGTVDRIGMKIGKLDVLDTDPVTRTDARVVEVHIKLDDSARAASLSNLTVDVTIGADTPGGLADAQ